MPTAVPPSYVLENDALLVNAEKRNCALKENFYLAAVAFRYLLVFTVAPRNSTGAVAVKVE